MWELLFHEVYKEIGSWSLKKIGSPYKKKKKKEKKRKEIGSPKKKKKVYREIIMYFQSVINAY